ncbi:hypothetical protein [Shouchella tritolerans]|uniref:hypothetical protein n=1 Tax=Shouchella tritolerans TaxID=2979466 RepID=UPI0021E6FC42|nr:hypothetical protein [Shouchella tritolerans]
MRRSFERRCLLVGGVWNITTALLTIFGYSAWFKQSGVKRLENETVDTMLATSQLISDVINVVLLFGLFMLVGGVVSLVIARKLKDNDIQNGILIWTGLWGALLFLAMDIIGFALYFMAFMMYVSKNKAIKIAAKARGNSGL